MGRAPTFYDILRVDPKASRADIRAAYLRLVKQYHPDRPSGADPVADRESELRRINYCYETLRSPAKRAAYDAGLAPRKSAPPIGATRVAVAGRESGVPWLPVLLLFGAVAASAYLAGKWGEQAARPPPSRGFSELDRRQLAPLSAKDIGIQVRSASTIAPAHAPGASAKCFADARRQSAIRAAELCVIFDEAFVYWNDLPTATALPPYFRGDLRRVRHVRALARWEKHAPARAAQLQQAAFAALIQDVRAQQLTAPASAGPAATRPRAANATVPDWDEFPGG